MDALKSQHSVFYASSTSDIKDDIVALTACMKVGLQSLSRQEATFLLWHHALSTPAKQVAIAAAGGVSACLGMADSTECSAAEKSSAAGLLLAMCQSQEAREDLVRGRSSFNTAAVILHASLLGEGHRLVRQYTVETLCLVAEDTATRGGLIRVLESESHGVPWVEYTELLLGKALPPVSLSGMCRYLAALLGSESQELRNHAIQADLVEGLLSVLRTTRTDKASIAALGCLRALAADKRCWARIEAAGGLNLLVDLLGAPPPALLRHEAELYMQVLDPKQYAARVAAVAAAAAAAAASAAQAELEVPETNRVNMGRRPRRISQSQSMGPGAHQAGQQAGQQAGGPKVVPPLTVRRRENTTSNSGAGTNRSAASGTDGGSVPPLSLHSTMALPPPPPLPPPLPAGLDQNALLSHNTLPVKWDQVAKLARDAAASVLYELAPAYVAALDRRLAATRLILMLVETVTAAQSGQKKPKKKKKAKLALTPEQTAVLVSVTGVLRLLSPSNLNRYRIAQPAGAIESLLALYEGASDATVRGNAQVLLTNVALIAENGQVLLDAKLPEHFLVPVPLRLDGEELTVLAKEYPGLEPPPRLTSAPSVPSAVALPLPVAAPLAGPRAALMSEHGAPPAAAAGGVSAAQHPAMT